MRKIFIINGLPGTGKTLFGSMVGEELKAWGIDFLHTSSIDLVKHILRPSYLWNEKVVPKGLWGTLDRLKKGVTDLDWDGATKGVYWRGVMSRLKWEISVNQPDMINQWVWSRVMSVDEGGWVFVDIREPENIRSFSDFCHEKSIGTPVRTVCILGDTHCEFDNPSDARVGDYPYDIFIRNERLKYGENTDGALRVLRNNALELIREELRHNMGGVEMR